MNLKKKLKKYNQEHLLFFENELNEEEKENLKKQIKKLPFKKMRKIYTKSMYDEKIEARFITYLKPFEKNAIDTQYFEKIGEKFIKNYAVITLSGGSGSRFGYDKAKGIYPFVLNEKATSMFQIEAEQLQKIAQKYHTYILWIIMTSEKNHNEIIEYFEKNNYFAYPKNKVVFLKQKSLPILDIKGNFVLKKPSQVLTASDGNGSIFKLLKDSKFLKRLQQEKIKYIQIINIDNLLVKMFDPIFIGLMEENGFLVGSKTLYKKDIYSKDYVFCIYKNHPFLYNLNNIIPARELEYFRDTFSGISLFHIKALKKLKNVRLPYHRAFKNYQFYQTNGNITFSKEKNSFKFEKFIFDGFFKFKTMLLYRIGTDEFYPVKDKASLDRFIKILEDKESEESNVNNRKENSRSM